MKVLITNSRLDGIGGSQIFVRDLGRALERLGHEVMAFSIQTGNPAQLERMGMIASTNDPGTSGFQPDIIHAQHHLDAMAAILAHPGVPAIYHCHGAVWRECVPKHPRIYHYLAMSRTLGERLMIESNIPAARITTWLNTVDLVRFAHVRQPVDRPAKALFYNKIHRAGSPTLQVIREAAGRLGMQLDMIGHKFGNEVVNPEDVLPGYDIVFASGKSAIDAIACGCAVVVLGRTSCGELVVPENYPRIRQVNFSIAVNSALPTVEEVEAELRRYSAANAAEVTARLRHDADHDARVRDLEAIYRMVISMHQASTMDPAGDAAAALAYLRKIVPLVRGTELAPVVERQ